MPNLIQSAKLNGHDPYLYLKDILQQVAALDGAAEIGDRGFVTALAAPDVGQQPLSDVGRDGLPALTGGFGESRQDSTGMIQRTQRRASFKSSSNCCSRSGDAMNPNRV